MDRHWNDGYRRTACAISRLGYHKEGVGCDRQASVCVDHMGVSVALTPLTRMHLGEAADKKMRRTGIAVREALCLPHAGQGLHGIFLSLFW